MSCEEFRVSSSGTSLAQGSHCLGKSPSSFWHCNSVLAHSRQATICNKKRKMCIFISRATKNILHHGQDLVIMYMKGPSYSQLCVFSNADVTAKHGNALYML